MKVEAITKRIFLVLRGTLIVLLAFGMTGRGYSHPCTYTDPIIIDLGRDGINLAERGNGVYFDISATGEKI
ncbi:hypothetical protein [Microbulbifer sp. VAAF005]|uniref:hypothetical protein n=1 Tax=Microbulbifer sp. VAAF005 TaxID=3034230 RepID=UPI0024AE51E1|nr:hypothetical protein [Microbulbifer sp. VAAF005]WHI45874.1 hypothetical protein P0078_19465 [Microbulbifer sp. VAAF005]